VELRQPGPVDPRGEEGRELDGDLFPNASIATFAYNADGLRTKKTTPNRTTQFIYDGTTLIAELDGDGNLLAVHIHGATGLISQRRGTTSHFYHFDGLGSTMELTDASGTVEDKDGPTSSEEGFSGSSCRVFTIYGEISVSQGVGGGCKRGEST
jgi:hypothetical protein